MSVTILQGDCRTVLKQLPEQSVQCCVTSPPYFGLRDYGCAGQIGLEPTPQVYVETLVGVFRELWRVLRDDGTLWLNLGDSYCGGGNYRGVNEETLSDKQASNRGATGQLAIGRNTAPPALRVDGLNPKNLIGIPWRVAFALQADGWYLRSDIIWAKPNPMPESVTDRCTKAHEYIFMLTKMERYYFDNEAIAEPALRPNGTGHFGGEKGRNHETPEDDPNYRNGHEQYGRFHVNDETRNKRSVWTVATTPYPDSHFATFPPDLIRPCILAGSKPGDTVLDPFGGSGTVGEVALEYGRKAILIELNPAYIPLIERRTNVTPGLPL